MGVSMNVRLVMSSKNLLASWKIHKRSGLVLYFTLNTQLLPSEVHIKGRVGHLKSLEDNIVMSCSLACCPSAVNAEYLPRLPTWSPPFQPIAFHIDLDWIRGIGIRVVESKQLPVLWYVNSSWKQYIPVYHTWKESSSNTLLGYFFRPSVTIYHRRKTSTASSNSQK